MKSVTKCVKSWELNCTVTLGMDEIRVWALHFSNCACNTANHAHSDAEIHIVTRGCKRFIVDFDNEILLEPGQILLISPNVFHAEQILSEESVEEHSVSFSVKNNSMVFAPYYRIETDAQKAIEYFLDIEKELSGEKGFCREIVQGYLTVFYGKLLRLCGVELRTQEKINIEKPQKNIIDEYFNDLFLQKTWKYTAEELAERLHISTRHLNRILHELYGMNFGERLVYIKLKYAEEQLLRSDKSIARISEECFWSEKYLVREFKKHHGITPLQFKKNYTKRTQI